MDQRNLRPARDFAIQFGVKALIYGAPGSGKTPILNTAPRPLLLACEPGLLSMRNSNVPTFLGYDAKSIDDFFEWFFKSAETKNYDTVAIDSTSQMAEIYVLNAQKRNSHGLKAYGEANTKTMEHLSGLYYTRFKHTYLIAKETIAEDNGTRIRMPYHPGKELPVKVPHMYDEILHLGIHNVPGYGQAKSFQCNGTFDILARDRTGSLSEYEPPDFSKLVAKAMA